MSERQGKSAHVYSYHTFIFPFLWNKGGNVARDDFERCIDKDHWELDVFDKCYDETRIDVERKEIYAQYQYFNAPARRAIYTMDEGQTEIVRNFRYRPEFLAKDGNSASYVISKKIWGTDNDGNKHVVKDYCYRLRINNLRLKLYSSGIGLLVYELENTEYKSIADVNHINEWGRRIFCPYLDTYDECDEKEDERHVQGTIKNPASSGLAADSIRLEGVAFGKKPDEESWSITAKDVDSKKMPKTESAQIVTKLLSNEKDAVPINDKVTVTTDPDESHPNRFYIEPIIDDRMFVACFVEDKSFTDRLAEWAGDEYRYLSDALKCPPKAEESIARQLYEFVFVDGDEISCHSRIMIRKLLEEHVYDRWLEYRYGNALSGTVYGVTEYSMVCAAASSFTAGPFLTQYIELTMLALAQRASLIAFQRRISHVSTDKKKEKEMMEAYVRFQSQLLMLEVTPQQQGIELYDMLLKSLYVNKEKADVENQIRNLFDFKNYKIEKCRNCILFWLSVAGGVCAIDVIRSWFCWCLSKFF